MRSRSAASLASFLGGCGSSAYPAPSAAPQAPPASGAAAVGPHSASSGGSAQGPGPLRRLRAPPRPQPTAPQAPLWATKVCGPASGSLVPRCQGPGLCGRQVVCPPLAPSGFLATSGASCAGAPTPAPPPSGRAARRFCPCWRPPRLYRSARFLRPCFAAGSGGARLVPQPRRPIRSAAASLRKLRLALLLSGSALGFAELAGSPPASFSGQRLRPRGALGGPPQAPARLLTARPPGAFVLARSSLRFGW